MYGVINIIININTNLNIDINIYIYTIKHNRIYDILVYVICIIGKQLYLAEALKSALIQRETDSLLCIIKRD